MSQPLATALMTVASILSGYFLSKVDPVEGAFAPYITTQWQVAVILSTLLLLCVLIPFHIHLSSKFKKYAKEQRELFQCAIATINRRSNMTIDLISKLDKIFKEYRYFLKPKQEKFIFSLLSDLRDLRITQEERKGNVSQEERKALVAEERTLLNRIEKSSSVIDKYVRKTT